MKKGFTIWIILALIVFYNSNLFADSPPTSEELSIHKLWKEYEAAYNAGNAEAISSLWVKDGDLFSLSGGIFNGRDEIATFFSKALSKNYKGSKFKLSIDQIRRLEENIAVVDGSWKITGEGLPKVYPASGIYTQVLLRSNNKWQIVAARPSVPLGGHSRHHGRKRPTTENLEKK